MVASWNTVHPQDVIFIEKSEEISTKELDRLVDFYLPIIGPTSFSLYQLLLSKEEVQVSELLNDLSVGLRDFYQAKSRLEALGLLRIYRSRYEENEYVYQLIMPLSAQTFLADDLLRALLTDHIGERVVNVLLNKYQIKEISKEFEEITQSFQDVFDFDVNKLEKLQPLDTDALVNTPDRLETIDVLKQARLTFDFSFYLNGLDRHFVKFSSITEDIQKLIATYHLLYGLDELQMQQLTIASADFETGKVSQKALTHEILSYVKKSNKKATKASEKSVQNPSTNLDESLIQFIQHAEKTPPARYLESIKEQKNGFATSDEGWILRELMQESNLTVGAINVLLHYILVVRDEPTLNKTYTLKIANDWVQNEVNTAEEAVLKVQALYDQSNDNKRTKPKSSSNRNYGRRKRNTESLPDWWGKESQNDALEIESQVPQNDFMERLANLRKQSEKGANE